MDEMVTPLEAGLAWTVDLESPRDFVGKSSLQAQVVGRKLVALLLKDRGGVLRTHQSVATAYGPGEITSGSFSPTLNNSIAFARVPAAVAIGDTVAVAVRDKQLAARVVKLPFVRHGKVLVTS
jgi:aminomethyltransferase